jgi:hypothetical protein
LLPRNVNRRLANGAKVRVDQSCTTRTLRRAFTFGRINCSCWRSS